VQEERTIYAVVGAVPNKYVCMVMKFTAISLPLIDVFNNELYNINYICDTYFLHPF
jgi:hypothetical protein